MQESKGFKGDIGRKAGKQTQEAGRPNSKGEKGRKLQDLVSSPRKWKNLESFDVELHHLLPEPWCQSKHSTNSKGSWVFAVIYEYKERVDATPAEEEI